MQGNTEEAELFIESKLTETEEVLPDVFRKVSANELFTAVVEGTGSICTCIGVQSRPQEFGIMRAHAIMHPAKFGPHPVDFISVGIECFHLHAILIQSMQNGFFLCVLGNPVVRGAVSGSHRDFGLFLRYFRVKLECSGHLLEEVACDIREGVQSGGLELFKSGVVANLRYTSL